jgi:hypothetical protein
LTSGQDRVNEGEGSQNSPENNPDKHLDVSGPKKRAKTATPPTSTAGESAAAPPSKDIFSSRKHSMEYVTVEGIKQRTGYYEKKDWYLLCIKEKLDNCVDWLQKNYQGASDAAIDVYIEKTNNSMLRIKVRNTNPKNIPVFTKDQLSAIFDYDMTYGSKQNLHIISRGTLGDAMKQILALPYVLIHTKDDGTAFIDKQWGHTLIIRCNKKEHHIFFHVNKASQQIKAELTPIDNGKELSFTGTEIEYTFPIIDEVNLDIQELAQFCREYPIFTTDISFRFKLVDNSPLQQPEEKFSDNPQVRASNQDIEKAVAETLKSGAPRAAIKIEYPALHPISTKWRNIGSIHTYMPTEFKTFIESVYDKENTSVDDRLRQLVEGTQMKKSADNEISIAQLLSDPNKDKKIERLFFGLKATLGAPEKLSLPYPTNNNERKEALVKRIARLYENKLDTKKAVYKAVHGQYKDEKITIPHLFEIIAIPYSDASIDKNEHWLKSTFKGSVNYSISPRGNIFEGDYEWDDPKKTTEFREPSGSDILDILGVYNFYFYKRGESKAKLPCVIFANLVTQRVDYHGKDKSRIDTHPFAETIIKAVRRIAEDIQTFKAAGHEFVTKNSRYFEPVRQKTKTIEDVIEEVVRQWI